MIGESQTRLRKGRAAALAACLLLAPAVFKSAAPGSASAAHQSAASAYQSPMLAQRSFAAVPAVETSAFEARPAHASARPAAPAPQRRPARQAPAARQKSSGFSHATAAHRRACDSCHKFPSDDWKGARAGGEPFPDVTQYPAHASCIGCHRRQFFSNERPAPSICSTCHESAMPRSIKLHPFPTLAEAFDKSAKAASPRASDFLIHFPHDKHLAVLGELHGGPAEDAGEVRFVRASFGAAARREPARREDAAKANEVCASCHQTYMPQGDSELEFVTPPPTDLPEGAFWLKKGTFKTSPAGHSSCFTCHSADAGISPAPSDCAACHKFPPPGAASPTDFDPQLAERMGVTDRRMLARWRDRQSAAFRHEWFSHAEMKCADCHKVEELNTADPRTRRVAVISCGGAGSGCHVTETDDDGGALNLAIAQRRADPAFTCTKCHAVLGASPVPASHASALSAIRK